MATEMAEIQKSGDNYKITANIMAIKIEKQQKRKEKMHNSKRKYKITATKKN